MAQQVKGEVLFEQKGTSVVVSAFFTELPPGQHGFHIHKAGDLRGEGCKQACDHYNAGPQTSHGGPPGSKEPRHTGDLGNISLGPGSAPFKKTYTLANLSVSDLYGRSMIVHADPDDLGKGPHDDSKTTGHSGARIACAVIGRVSCEETKGGGALFNDNPGGKSPRVPGTGYGTRKRAQNTIKKLKGKPIGLKRQIATTLYYRAKHHAYQTKNMREAMKVFSKYLKTLKRK